jgi:hypothetical protein
MDRALRTSGMGTAPLPAVNEASVSIALYTDRH